MKRIQLQNTSWFNEKSRNNINALQDITNFLNNSINILEKGDISPLSSLNTATNRKSLLKDIIKAKTTKTKNNVDKSNLNFKRINKLDTPKSNYKYKKIHSFHRKSNEKEFKSDFF